MTLAVSLGGYTVAESTTHQVGMDGLQAAAQAEVQARREAAVAAERQRALATAQDAIADAAAVQTVAAPAVAEADLAPLVEAMGELNALIVHVPEVPAAVEALAADAEPPAEAAPAATATASGEVVDREARASRAAGREAVPTDEAATEAATDAAETSATPDDVATPPAAEAPQDTAAEAAKVEADAAQDAAADAPADGGVDDATGDPVPADDAAPDDALAARILLLVAKVSEVSAQVRATADANVAAQKAAAAAAAEAEARAAAAAAAAAAEKAAQRASLDAYANGQIPVEALCEIPGGHQLRCDAADAFTAMDAAFQAQFGTPLTVSDSYRSYAAQVACVRVKGYLCARPGTSNHGLGVAVDLAGGIQSFGTAQHEWMARNAGQFGWDLPDWASAGGSKPEAWHWEYIG